MDITTIKTTARTIEIKHPKNDELIGLRINLVSLDDERLTKIKRSISDRRLHLEARGKVFKAEEIEDNANRLMFAAIDDWEWYNPTGKEGDEGYSAEQMGSFAGDQPEFNNKNFNAVIEAAPWIRSQINEALSETTAFFVN